MDDKDLIIETMAKHNADLTALVQSLTETIKELEETIREAPAPAESELPEQFQATFQ